MPVKSRELKQVVPRHSENRRGRRMNSRVPIHLEWDDPKGRRCSADAHTRVVNPYGCMVVLREFLDMELRVALTNLATESSNAAIVVWRGNRQHEGQEYGVELVAPDMDFWGLEL